MDMKRPTPLIIALVAVVSMGLLIARYTRDDDPCVANPLRCGPGAASTNVGSVTSGDVPVSIARKPLPVGPFDSVRVELKSRANSGDAEAAYRLGRVIAQCMSYKPLMDSAFVDNLAEVVVTVGRLLRIGGRSIDDQDLLELMLYSKGEFDRSCAGTDELRRSGRVEDAYVWIQRAAALGHTGAMATYAEHAFTEFGDHAALLDHAAEVARRRETARAMLEQALRAGEPKALMALAKEHGKGGLLQRDSIRALAYWNAYRQSAEGLAQPSVLVRMGDTHYRGALDAAQQRQAERLSMEIRTAQRTVGGRR